MAPFAESRTIAANKRRSTTILWRRPWKPVSSCPAPRSNPCARGRQLEGRVV